MPKKEIIYSKFITFKVSELFNQMIESAWRTTKHESRTEFIRNAIAFYLCDDRNSEVYMDTFWDAEELQTYKERLKTFDTVKYHVKKAQKKNKNKIWKP